MRTFDPNTYIIQPSHLKVDGGFEALEQRPFLDHVFNQAAFFIVWLAQQRGRWDLFSLEALRACYRSIETGSWNNSFCAIGFQQMWRYRDLIGCIGEAGNRRFFVTHEFVVACFSAWPAERLVSPGPERFLEAYRQQ